MSKHAAFIEQAASYKGDACLLWPYGKQKNGYAKAYYDGRVTTAHRVICLLINGPPPTPEHETAHSCNTKLCLTPAHISWKTHQSNIDDKSAHGTQPVGEANPAAKLTEEQVCAIRQSELPQKVLAAQFGVTQPLISKIQTRRIWPNVD